jgi:heme oxygenase
MASSGMLMRLNMETRAEHPEADSPWLELMSVDTSRGQYIDQLVATYGFEAPVEAAFMVTSNLAEVVKLRDRARARYIIEDLQALGITPAKIAKLPQCRHIEPFCDPAEALGWMYVLERATLLHDAVRSHIALRLPTVSGWSYLSAYQGVASARWQELGAALDSYATTPGRSDQIIASARAAFSRLREWVATHPGRTARDAWVDGAKADSRR